MPPGSCYNWSEQFENEVRAKKRLQIIVPIAIGIIYILLYLTYRSFLEAAHVLLAVPFALTDGLYLLWLLHYNFSVAVWVGFIALFGTAMQTTVVMVIYLEEAVEREFERVRGAQSIHVDVRVVAASNRDLKAAIAGGTLRQDLFYRLNVFPIEVPPLRERKDDILMLLEYFVKRYASRAGKNIRSIDKKTLELFQSYHWPGNTRELQNIIERSVILSSGDVFSIDESWLSKESSQPVSRVQPSQPFEVEPRSEREMIEAALAVVSGLLFQSRTVAADTARHGRCQEEDGKCRSSHY